jgi:hypothetical protein
MSHIVAGEPLPHQRVRAARMRSLQADAGRTERSGAPPRAAWVAPFRLGHSSHFRLGLFLPQDKEDAMT